MKKKRKGKGTGNGARTCIVCLRTLPNSHHMVKHYQESQKCDRMRKHPRFARWASSQAKKKAIQYWIKNRKLPAWRRSTPPVEGLPTRANNGAAKPRRKITKAPAPSVAINFCPTCGLNLEELRS